MIGEVFSCSSTSLKPPEPMTSEPPESTPSRQLCAGPPQPSESMNMMANCSSYWFTPPNIVSSHDPSGGPQR
jgi:hypothetical protein